MTSQKTSVPLYSLLRQTQKYQVENQKQKELLQNYPPILTAIVRNKSAEWVQIGSRTRPPELNDVIRGILKR